MSLCIVAATVQQQAAQHSTAQHGTAQHSIALSCTWSAQAGPSAQSAGGSWGPAARLQPGSPAVKQQPYKRPHRMGTLWSAVCSQLHAACRHRPTAPARLESMPFGTADALHQSITCITRQVQHELRACMADSGSIVVSMLCTNSCPTSPTSTGAGGAPLSPPNPSSPEAPPPPPPPSPPRAPLLAAGDVMASNQLLWLLGWQAFCR
jgi:hypothetical protein